MSRKKKQKAKQLPKQEPHSVYVVNYQGTDSFVVSRFSMGDLWASMAQHIKEPFDLQVSTVCRCSSKDEAIKVRDSLNRPNVL